MVVIPETEVDPAKPATSIKPISISRRTRDANPQASFTTNVSNVSSFISFVRIKFFLRLGSV